MLGLNIFRRSPNPSCESSPVVLESPAAVTVPSPIITNPDGTLIDLKDYLARELTTDQQKLFMASTWMYLNRNRECCINLENAMTWMGVVDKKTQKAKLERRFRAEIDYQVLQGGK
ncbi:hypothetical protein HK102_005999 [Quaeritorhiza haematococci]|nr:hypothetical protein HK102_005999 [Quaeritorhiza haematococci]